MDVKRKCNAMYKLRETKKKLRWKFNGNMEVNRKFNGNMEVNRK